MNNLANVKFKTTRVRDLIESGPEGKCPEQAMICAFENVFNRIENNQPLSDNVINTNDLYFENDGEMKKLNYSNDAHFNLSKELANNIAGDNLGKAQAYLCIRKVRNRTYLFSEMTVVKFDDANYALQCNMNTIVRRLMYEEEIRIGIFIGCLTSDPRYLEGIVNYCESVFLHAPDYFSMMDDGEKTIQQNSSLNLTQSQLQSQLPTAALSSSLTKQYMTEVNEYIRDNPLLFWTTTEFITFEDFVRKGMPHFTRNEYNFLLIYRTFNNLILAMERTKS